ncbi:hypothetical protein M0R45_036207 [Rubus argutus]|uniref:Transposase, Ptta/En/Spm, plant n=1 Tax=Rubus argutus TaxID=59490 RepID=A0AAW1W0X1_RUBAR
MIETVHDSDTEDEEFSPGNKRRGNKRRGNNKLNWARRGSVEILKPNETVARWQRYLGLMVQDHTLFGVDVFDWRTFRKTKVLDEAWCKIKRTIDWFDPDTRKKSRKIQYTVERKLNDRWKQFKAKLRKEWYAPNWGTEARFHCGDKRINNNQWVKLVDHWEKPKGQIEHEGAEPDRCTMFELTHTRSDGKPVDKESKKAIKISTIKDAKRASHLPEIITNIEMNEVYASVLGKEKHGAIRGFGIGVRLDDVPDVLVAKRGAQLDVQALREEHEAKLDHIRKESQEREAKLRDKMNKQEMATTDRMKRLEMQLLNQQAMFERFM